VANQYFHIATVHDLFNKVLHDGLDSSDVRGVELIDV
jgi:hypothetical protein